jgi:hypothetical protein
MPGTGTCRVMNARKVTGRVIARVICKELERVSGFACLRVHACARVLECACMSASSPHRAYSRCCRSSGPLGQPPPSGDTPSTVWRVRYVSSKFNNLCGGEPCASPLFRTRLCGTWVCIGRACCVRVCMRVRLWVLSRLRCRYERNDVRICSEFVCLRPWSRAKLHCRVSK